MKWESKKLDNCCISITDGDHQPPPKSELGVPFITISNITSFNKIDFSNTMFVPEEYYCNLDKKRKAISGDVLYSVVGSFGIPVFINDDKPFVFQRHIAILKVNNQILLPKFLYYTMLSREFYAQADAVAIGSAQRTISLSSLRNIKIDVPCIQIQERIVNILSAYDNLIENNQKQIKLLEEAAQRLYKEWFVDLRFPGYENVPIVDCVPKGWNKSLLKEISEFKRGKTITKNSVNNGSIPVVAGGLEPAYYHNKANTTAPVITVSGSGANAGFTKLYYNDVWASDCSFVDSNNTEYIYFVYCFLKNNKDRIDNLQKGSAQPHVYAKDINALSFNLPNTEILNMFSEIIEPYFALIGKLQKQIRAAEQARDRLLPRLMSGELEV